MRGPRADLIDAIEVEHTRRLKEFMDTSRALQAIYNDRLTDQERAEFDQIAIDFHELTTRRDDTLREIESLNRDEYVPAVLAALERDNESLGKLIGRLNKMLKAALLRFGK